MQRLNPRTVFSFILKIPYAAPLLLFLFLTTVNPLTLPAQVQNPDQVEQDYLTAVKKGDQYYTEEKFDRALYEYETARKLKPAEKYPQDRIKVIHEILDEQKTKNILFEVSITSAEQWFKAGDYKRAKAEYETALRIVPGAQYPKDRLAQINKIWSDPEVDAAYAAAILRADDLFAQKRYLDAKTDYIKASDLKPYEQYPLDRIIAINEILAQLQQQQDQYDGLIARADGFFNDKEYQDAKATYQDASNIKPDEVYPKNRIKEIEGILTRLQAERDAYEKIIALADEYYIAKDFEKAKVEYQKAAEMKSLDNYPKSMLAKIDPLIAQMQQIQQEYDLIIANANNLLQKKDFEGALALYEKAGTIKPLESLPKDKIEEINRTLNALAEQKDKEQRYTAAIGSADSLFNLENLDLAKSFYQQASEISPDQTYPAERIKEIGSLQSALAGYDQAVALADRQFEEKKYQEALGNYQKALNFKPEEVYPSEKINEITILLSDLKAIEDAYTGAIQEADRLFDSREYSSARVAYEQASSIKPGESYPASRITEIDRILAEQNEREDAYRKALADGNQFFDAKKYEDALVNFQKALELKPGEKEPQDKINDINVLLTNIQAKDEAYSLAIQKADGEFSSKDYENAKGSYENASLMKPEETYPRSKIEEIETILADLSRIQQEYDKAIASGDEYFSASDYNNARNQYNTASGLKPEEQYPKDRINEINGILQEKLALDEAYAGYISSGDDLLGKKDYQNALTAFKQASQLKPGENYPRDKIKEIEGILANLAAQDQEYQQAVAAADNLLASSEYTAAIVEYQKALRIKPEEPYPQNKIDEINRILTEQKEREEYDKAIASGDQLFANAQYANARQEYVSASGLKPEEQYPIDRISEIDRIVQEKQAREDAYAGFISTGDDLLNKKDYQNALTAYKQASELKPEESYPKNKITQIEGILADLAAQDQEYQQAISAADAFFATSDYLSANIEYQKALRIKPQETYPQDKINEINQILADIKAKDEQYQNAVAEGDRLLTAKNYQGAMDAFVRARDLKPSEAYPGEKIQEISQILDQLKKDEDYKLVMEQADALAGEKRYGEAITTYRSALEIKPGEKIPQDKIASIQAILDDIAARKKAYDGAIVRADDLFSSKDYEKARQAYQDALDLDPAQTYPQEQMERIDGILRELQVQQSFDEAVARADEYFTAKDYDNARTEYQKALNIIPDESYPQNKIQEINTIIAVNEQARQMSFNESVKSGDSYFALEDYKNAKVQYQNAISLYPDQQYPRNKLKQVEDILLAKEMELKQAYQQAIAKADNLYQQKILDEAIDAYMQAIEIKPDEIYPENMIRQIKKYIEEHAIVDILNSSVIINSNTERKFDFIPVDIRMRKNNYIVMKARVLSEAKPKVYLNYGQDAQRSGGIVLKSIKDNEMNDYIIRVSAQDPWYRNDNNWLKLYSEGGDIEVTYIQISTAD